LPPRRFMPLLGITRLSACFCHATKIATRYAAFFFFFDACPLLVISFFLLHFAFSSAFFSFVLISAAWPLP